MKKEEKNKPSRLAGWFRTHPSTDDRIVAALDEQRFLPEKDYYIVNTSEFNRVKARLQSIENARDAEQEEINSYEQKRPTLKRRTPGSGGEDTGGGGEDDGSAPEQRRPTLKRPDPEPDSAF